jgi:hypothetical protein
MASAIFLRFMLMMTMWLPWGPGWAEVVTTAPLDLHFNCQGAWMGWDRHIHFCMGEHANLYPWATVHELQHWLYHYQLDGRVWDWDEFGQIAMAALQEGDYTEEQMFRFEWAYQFGGMELHAEIPWWTRGDIPPSLQKYYPWFDLGKAGKCPNEAD